jgi:hypothetical protein
MESYKKKYSLILNLIKKLRLFLRQDKDFNWVLNQFDIGWKMIFIMGSFTFLGMILGEVTIQEFLRDLKWGPVLLLAIFLLRKMRSATKDLFSIKLALMLPEDLQAILKDMQERWIKKQYSLQKIRSLTLIYLFDMVLGYVKSQITNIWLPNDSSTKEIE